MNKDLISKIVYFAIGCAITSSLDLYLHNERIAILQHRLNTQEERALTDNIAAYEHCGSLPDICASLFPDGARRIKEVEEELKAEKEKESEENIGQ